MPNTLKDRILLKRAEKESYIIDNTALADQTLHGELLLCYEKDKERLYCKNSANVIVPIHHIWDAGEIDDGLSVDLGLSVLWAKTNLGADKEAEAGLYFQWGDTQGYTAEQVGNGEGLKYFDWDDYKWSIDGSSSNFSKYTGSDKAVLDLEDDAAHVMLGGSWRMPTYDECLELYQNTKIYLVLSDGREIEADYDGAQEQDGVYMIPWTTAVTGETGVTISGCKFCNKSDDSKYIFVPASGIARDGSVYEEGVYGYWWSSSLSSQDVNRAWNPGFVGEGCGIDYGYRRRGYGVRAVRPKE